ncbi:MAG: hypothetical protein R2708_27790 [Vicinamibacterales bacterium]
MTELATIVKELSGPLGGMVALIFLVRAFMRGDVRHPREVVAVEVERDRERTERLQWQELALGQQQTTDRALGVAQRVTTIAHGSPS